jgi:hypothetical protein
MLLSDIGTLYCIQFYCQIFFVVVLTEIPFLDFRFIFSFKNSRKILLKRLLQ